LELALGFIPLFTVKLLMFVLATLLFRVPPASVLDEPTKMVLFELEMDLLPPLLPPRLNQLQMLLNNLHLLLLAAASLCMLHT
jgi:hypothetical protein